MIEILEPLAKWGAALLGLVVVLAGGWRVVKKGVRSGAKLEISDARNKAFEEQGKRRTRTRETRAQRRARLERRVRDAKD